MSFSIDSPVPFSCRIRVFGGFEVEGVSGRRIRAKKSASLTALLSLKPGQRHRRDALCALFWPDDTSEQQRQSLRTALSGIRAVVGEALSTEAEFVWLDPEAASSDSSELLQLLADTPSASAWDQISQLVSGEFCAGLEGLWIEPERRAIEDQLADAACRFMAGCLTKGTVVEGVKIGSQLTKMVGWRQDVGASLIELCVSGGLYTLALAHYESLEKSLLARGDEEIDPRISELLESIPVQSKNALSLVGRADEFQSILQWFYARQENQQAICLTGPGGVGKTTLTRAVLRELEAAGFWVSFVNLSAANSFQSAVQAICTSLELGEVDLADAPLAIAEHLIRQKGVVALDNLEQLGGDADQLIKELIRASKEVRLILTTRNKIALDGILEFPVSPLGLPDSGESLDRVMRASSVQLFERRASQVSTGFVIHSDNVASVTKLCQKLDGLPLALEIAAAQVVVQSPAQILNQIQKSLVSLRKRHGAKSIRHSSVNAAVNWSIGLLDEQDRIAALRLSLLGGRFSAEDAIQITENATVLRLLESLVRASILNSDSSAFWMYETVRLSIQDIFGSSIELVAARNRQFDVIIQRLAANLETPNLKNWEKLQLDLITCPDALDCMEFFAARNERAIDIAETAVRIQEVCRLYGLHERNIKCLEAVQHHKFEGILSAKVGLAIVRSQANRGSEEEKIATLVQCEEDAAGDILLRLRIKSQLATCYKSLGNMDKAVEQMIWIEENSSNDAPDVHSLNQYQLNQIAFLKGDRKMSLHHLSRALEYGRQSDDINRLIRILFDYGSELAYHQKFEESLACFEEAISHCQRIRTLKLEGLTRWQYGDALISMSRHQDALEMLLRSVELVYEANYHVAEKWIFLKTVDAAVSVGVFEPAARLLGKGLHVRALENRPFAQSEEDDIKRCSAAIVEQLGRGEFERLSAEGRDLSWPEVWKSMRISSEIL